jgi:hypothetical protein
MKEPWATWIENRIESYSTLGTAEHASTQLNPEARNVRIEPAGHYYVVVCDLPEGVPIWRVGCAAAGPPLTEDEAPGAGPWGRGER